MKLYVDRPKNQQNRTVDKARDGHKIAFVRVAARFFSGVPHPHLLGVCRPNTSEPFPPPLPYGAKESVLDRTSHDGNCLTALWRSCYLILKRN